MVSVLNVASGIVYADKTVALGLHALSVLISTTTFPVGVPPVVDLYKYTHVSLLFVGVKDCASLYCNHQASHTVAR